MWAVPLIFNITASTSGTYGATISWSYTDNFPASGGDDLDEPLDVESSYFYLTAVNTSTVAVKSLIVNEGLTSQTNKTMNIPNNGNTYGIGYYLAFSNTVIQATYTDNSITTLYSLPIPNTSNASYTADL